VRVFSINYYYYYYYYYYYLYVTISSNSHSIIRNRETTSGHSNRIFGLRFHPKNANILVTAGWDDTIQVWDINKEMSVTSIYGPHVCGDSLDFDDSGKFLLAGSYTRTDPLQMYSFEVLTTPPSITKLSSVPWRAKDDETVASCLVYCSQFFHDVENSGGDSNEKGVVANRFLLAGGGGTSNEVRMFDAVTKHCVGIVSNISGSVYCCTMTNVGILTSGSTIKSNFAVIAGADKNVRVMELLLASNPTEQEFLF
jgi:WD40 repeat protein